MITHERLPTKDSESNESSLVIPMYLNLNLTQMNNLEPQTYLQLLITQQTDTCHSIVVTPDERTGFEPQLNCNKHTIIRIDIKPSKLSRNWQ